MVSRSTRKRTKEPTSSSSRKTRGATGQTSGRSTSRQSSCKDCGSGTRRLSAPGPRCATCHRNRRNAVSLARRLTYVAKQYNLTGDEYLALLSRFEGLCWICRYRKARQVDHDHKCCSGKTSCGKCVRGLLCGPCNKFLGFIRDNVTILQFGIDYLNDYKERRDAAA